MRLPFYNILISVRQDSETCRRDPGVEPLSSGQQYQLGQAS